MLLSQCFCFFLDQAKRLGCFPVVPQFQLTAADALQKQVRPVATEGCRVQTGHLVTPGTHRQTLLHVVDIALHGGHINQRLVIVGYAVVAQIGPLQRLLQIQDGSPLAVLIVITLTTPKVGLSGRNNVRVFQTVDEGKVALVAVRIGGVNHLAHLHGLLVVPHRFLRGTVAPTLLARHKHQKTKKS